MQILQNLNPDYVHFLVQYPEELQKSILHLRIYKLDW